MEYMESEEELCEEDLKKSKVILGETDWVICSFLGV